MSSFTEEQLRELETRYGLKPVEEVLPVRDGVVRKGDYVWWRGEFGPKEVSASNHWFNIKEYPSVYQLAKPNIDRVTYLD